MNFLRASLWLGLTVLVPSYGQASEFIQTDLVSDIQGLASITDPSLVNPWGLSHSATSPIWISDQAANVSTLYAVNAGGVTKAALTVSIPTAAGPQGPTGQVFNNTTSFALGGMPSSFIFANLNGTISAWNSTAGTTAHIMATTSGAVYTGLTLLGTNLYAANGAQNRIDVFDGSFAPVTLASSAFVDPNLPAGYVPFNVQSIGGRLYVTYAPAGRAAQTVATPGMGFIDVFDANGGSLQRLVTGSQLAAPWGITLSPAGFGTFGNKLLVGNFSFDASEINAFDPITGTFFGTIPIDTGSAGPGGLWALSFGTGGNNGDLNTLFFTDGINRERDGLFGSIRAVPEPSTWAMMLIGFGALAFASYRRVLNRTSVAA